LIIPFLIYQVVANDDLSLFSLMPILFVIAGTIAFMLATHIANLLLIALLSMFFVPFMLKDHTPSSTVTILQNIQTSILVVFGLFLCAFAWFFASYTVDYMFSSTSI